MMGVAGADGAGAAKGVLWRGVGLWRRRLRPDGPLRFDNAALRELPVDAEPRNFVRSRVVGACLSRVTPTPLVNPQLVLAARAPLALVGLDLLSSDGPQHEDEVAEDGDAPRPIDELAPFLAGNELFEGSDTAAQCYCGHQFGYFSGQLGDGAAISLGEVVSSDDAAERWEMQLKGAGLTPYSRQADGRKVLRSTLREFLASEHMHALGVPTTRAGGVVMSTDTQVLRDVFYDGNAKLEPTAVVLRIARCFLRFGSFEIFKNTDAVTGRAGPSAHLEDKRDRLQAMLDFTLRYHFADIWAQADATTEQKVVQLFAEVVRRTARLVAKWQALGFCHGVLNTDNMSIVGDTLDYGPFGFMEHFDPKHVCNTSDDSGRYRFEAQPEICKWNCGVLADQLALVVPRQEFDAALASFDETFEREYYALMREKLGLLHKEVPARDKQLVDALLDTLAATGADFTYTFRCLAALRPFQKSSLELVRLELVEVSETLAQLKRKRSSYSEEQVEMVRRLLVESPAQARMYGITDAVVAKMAEESKARAALDAMTDADREQQVREAWTSWLELYAARLRDETDGQVPEVEHEVRREQAMRRVNPVYVLRNHVAQQAIDWANDGELERLAHLFELLTHPFDESADPDDHRFARPHDPDAAPICVSCSS